MKNEIMNEVKADTTIPIPSYAIGNKNHIDRSLQQEEIECTLNWITHRQSQKEKKREKMLNAANDGRNQPFPPSKNPNDCASIFGCSFSTASWEQALQTIEQMIAEDSPVPKICAFVNADCLNQYYTNAAYAGFLSQADFLMPDGIGVAIAAKWRGTPVKANLNGSDLLPKLCSMTYSIYFLGAAPGVAEKAKMNLERDYPGVKIVGADHGFFADEAAEHEAIERINRVHPDILLVGMGVPRQEAWLFRHREELSCKVAMGVGGVFDFASGRIPRAPVWLRKLRLEWTYRLYNEPFRLFRRYVIGNPLFLWRMILHGSKNIHSTTQMAQEP